MWPDLGSLVFVYMNFYRPAQINSHTFKIMLCPFAALYWKYSEHSDGRAAVNYMHASDSVYYCF